MVGCTTTREYVSKRSFKRKKYLSCTEIRITKFSAMPDTNLTYLVTHMEFTETRSGKGYENNPSVPDSSLASTALTRGIIWINPQEFETYIGSRNLTEHHVFLHF